MTYRERREARAERLNDWADKRDAKADAVFERNRPITSDWAFITQPGHMPARARIIAQEDRAYESKVKADAMRSKAANIAAASAGAIYSDDPDAIEALQAKIDRLEAERARIKAYNVSCRKAAKVDPASIHGDLSLLDEAQQAWWLSTMRVASWQMKNGAYPGYHTSNLGATINAAKKRLAELSAHVD